MLGGQRVEAALGRGSPANTSSVIRVRARGQMALAVTPYLARARAVEVVSPTMPPLAAA